MPPGKRPAKERTQSTRSILVTSSRLGKGAHKEYKPPTLIFGQPFLEGWHGLSAFTDLIKDLTVSDGIHVPDVGDIGRSRIVHRGLRAIALAAFTMALGALIYVNPPGRLQSGL